MKAFIVKADTAQSITQWYWRTPTSSRYRELLRPDLTYSRTRCCKLAFPWIDLPPTINHEGRNAE